MNRYCPDCHRTTTWTWSAWKWLCDVCGYVLHESEEEE